MESILRKIATIKLKVANKQKNTQKKKEKKKKIEQLLKISRSPSIIEISPMSKRTTRSSMSPKPVKESLNEKIAKLLSELSSLMMKAGEPMKARAYQKAEEYILGLETELISVDELRGKPGFGPTILAKIDEYLKTGTLGIIERERAKPEYIFTNIYGVGPQKAKELVQKGVTTLDDLRAKQGDLLNKVQQVGLKYYEDILERIPRKEIDDYHAVFESSINKGFDGKYEIVGSYRRGLQTSGDIDIIITSENPENFDIFLDRLIDKKVIVEVLSRGKSKCLVVAKIPSSNTYRRVDFLYTSPKEYPFAILYFTGSKAFNAVMRGHALKKGYSLNEHGFSKMSSKEGDKKETKGSVIEKSFASERNIFDFLGLQYIDPVDRIDGRNIISLGQSPRRQTASPILQENPEPIKEVEPEPIKEPEPKKKSEKKREPKKTPQKISKKKSPPSPISEIKTETTVDSKKIKEFTEQGIVFLESLSESELLKMIETCKNAYYNENRSLLTDNEFDILVEFTQNKFSKNAGQEIGAPVIGKNKVELPFEMASMDKIKPDSGALAGWMTKYTGPYNLSCKLDGVSGLYICNANGKHSLYTRGDGHIGQDISHLIKILRLPKMAAGTAVRGEFIMPKAVFLEKYADSFANARNLVSGLINKKSVDEKCRDLDFVTYEVVSPPMKPSEQMQKLKQLGLKVVQNQLVAELNNEFLSALLVDWRKSYLYEIDGVIVANDAIYERATGNPDHAFAFKMVLSDQVAEAKVLDVIWTPSKDGYLKPRVRIEPIQLAGVRIEYATGFNGKFIEENRIGLGAVITMIRSGDVIPYIQSVTTPAEKAKMPTVPYEWTDTHVDIKLKDPSKDATVLEKNITNFFVHLEVDGLSSGNIKRIIKAGFSSIPVILKMNKADFEKVEGFKSKMIEKVYSGIQEKVGKASLLEIMVASGKLGRGLGERKVRPILLMYPDILVSKESNKEKIEMLKKVSGIGKENAAEFVDNIPAFLEFLRECSLENKLNSPIKEPLENHIETSDIDTSNPFYQKKVVMTKTRDKDIIDFVTKMGGSLEDSMKKDTFVLIVKSVEDTSSKTEYAKKNGIPILSVEQFKEKYM
jgi:NAD-dependent DNA ligase